MSTYSNRPFAQYAFDDFAISQVAKALGKASDGKKVRYRLMPL